jgi:hypothetical protein
VKQSHLDHQYRTQPYFQWQSRTQNAHQANLMYGCGCGCEVSVCACAFVCVVKFSELVSGTLLHTCHPCGSAPVTSVHGPTPTDPAAASTTRRRWGGGGDAPTDRPTIPGNAATFAICLMAGKNPPTPFEEVNCFSSSIINVANLSLT